jgi:serine protease AprX
VTVGDRDDGEAGEEDVALSEGDRRFIARLMYGTGTIKRFTQDSPILPDVWMAFYTKPNRTVDLLLTPHRGTTPGSLAHQLRKLLVADRTRRPARGYNVAYNQATVAAELTFLELIRVVLPMTRWWYERVWRPGGPPLDALTDPKIRAALARALLDPEQEAKKLGVAPDLLWMLRVAGAISLRARTKKNPPLRVDRAADWQRGLAAVAALLKGMKATEAPREGAFIWNVSRNRRAQLTVIKSGPAIKADAAARVFDIKCSKLTWAIVDSGIDATHRAFQRREGAAAAGGADPGRTEERLKRSRVLATYDFTVIRDLLNVDAVEDALKSKNKVPPHLQKALSAAKRGDEVREALQDLHGSLKRGREVDWHLVEPLIRVPHDGEYRKPQHDHGTHVAGILAADWPKAVQDEGETVDMRGICPDLRLYDLRVLKHDGTGDEFAVIAALQFIRYLNARQDYVVVHGANVSLSIRHDISNYACGRTPVCDECDRLVSSGVVVVAAAGNLGFHRIQTEAGFMEGYQSVSITDPGNADGVITVGATHRYRPHTYGVSYFSSRGPTGDGRPKPDLVAPGEKITAPVPDDGFGVKDGTSMATPHVSGAAALLMARYNELVGRPARIKQILRDTATDLGRERYFQGSGMLDVLRALQAI